MIPFENELYFDICCCVTDLMSCDSERELAKVIRRQMSIENRRRHLTCVTGHRPLSGPSCTALSGSQSAGIDKHRTDARAAAVVLTSRNARGFGQTAQRKHDLCQSAVTSLDAWVSRHIDLPCDVLYREGAYR